MTTFLYNSAGTWIAFRPEGDYRYLFNTDGDWIGWFAWSEDDVATRDGRYLGTVVGDRLLSCESAEFRGTPTYPGAPTYPGQPPYPGAGPYESLPQGFTDLPGSQLWPAPAWPQSAAS